MGLLLQILELEPLPRFSPGEPRGEAPRLSLPLVRDMTRRCYLRINHNDRQEQL